MEKTFLTQAQCDREAADIATFILGNFKLKSTIRLFGVPRGGVPVAYLVRGFLNGMDFDVQIMKDAEIANVIVDDLIDSGTTKARYEQLYPTTPFLALFDKGKPELAGKWLVFPWERTEERDQSADDIVVRLLQYIGEDPFRGGLKETPTRVLKAWKEWTSGYGVAPSSKPRV